MTRSPSPDPEALLCRQCGYVIDGLPAEANCSECGADVAGSLPSARTGTLWENQRIYTRYRGLPQELGPKALFTAARFETHRCRFLLWTNLSIAAVILTVHSRPSGEWLLTRFTPLTPVVPGEGQYLKSIAIDSVALAVSFAAALIALRLLVWVERLGIRFFSRQHGFRITPRIAQGITAHASIGWIAGAFLSLVGVFAGHVVAAYAMANNVGPIRPALQLAPIWMPIAGFLLGLLWFETLVYIGVRTCRYANLPPDSNRPATANPGSGAA